MPVKRQRTFVTYIVVVSVAGCLAMGLHLSASLKTGSFFGEYPWLLLTLAVLVAAAELRPVLFMSNGTGATSSWTFAFAMLFIAPPAACLAVSVLARVCSDMSNKKAGHKTIFNAGQYVLSLAGAVWAGSQISDLVIISARESVDFAWLAAALVMFAAAFLINMWLIATAIGLDQGLPILAVVRRLVDGSLFMNGLLLALAPVFAVIGVESPILIPLVMVSTITIYRSASIAMSNRHEATHDPLTGVSNRRLFEDRAAMMLDSAKSEERKVGFILIDLDGFKGINDRLGHHHGDVVLKIVAERLCSGRPPTDFVSRLGGDEFAIAIGELASEEEVLEIATEILDAIENPMDVEGMPLAISASVGISLFPAHGDNLESLLHHADTAMYEAKSLSPGIQIFAASDDEAGPNRLHLVADLVEAIGTDQLTMHYQPRFELGTGEILSVEALLRWEHPTHGALSPAWFMPQAEQTELMKPLTESVLDMSLATIASWHKAGLRVGIAVNISARNLHDLRFPSQVAETLDKHRVDAAFLEIEITENTVMADPKRSKTVLAELRQLGVRISIDDFGTGYSSLVSLRNLTVDCIKIDRSFITHLDSQPGDFAIARSIIDLAKNFGLRTVAEGVETQEVLEIVASLGCDSYQGYFGSRPVDEAAAFDLLSKNAAEHSVRDLKAA